MNPSIKNKFSGAFLILNICAVIFLLISDLATLADPQKYWPVALLGIGFPIIALCCLLMGLSWLFGKRKRALISLVALLISFPNIRSTFPVSFSSSFSETKSNTSLRIMTWNVGLMNYTQVDSSIAIANNAVIFQKIKSSDADVVCLQEFFSAVITGNYYNIIDSMKKTMRYPYHYFSLDNPKFDHKFYNGTIIFSRLPIIDTAKVVYPLPFIGSVIKASVLFGTDTVDIFSTRLQSVNFTSNEYQELHSIKNAKENSLQSSKNIIQKLRIGYGNRSKQVDIVKSFMSASRRAAVLTGDFNDVPVSYAAAQLKAGMKDAWEQKGSGLGRTFKFIYPTLRIDHILFTNAFKVVQVKRILSGQETDHHAIVSDLELIKNGE